MRLTALLLCLASPLAAQQEAIEAAAQLQAARAQLEAAESGRDQISALTQTVQAYETGLVAMRAGLREITLREAAIADDLTARRSALTRLLGALSTISRRPRQVTLSHPQGAQNAARAGMVLADMSRALQAEATALRTQLDTASALRAARETAAQTLQDGLAGAQTARVALGQAISDRVALPTRFDADPVQTALLIASAETLHDFAISLATDTPDTETTLAPAANLPLPVAGIVQSDDGRAGITIAAAPRALVTTPAPATILFQGSLLDYGTVVILEPSTDVLFILAGLAEVFVDSGEILPAGAPIGLLGGTPTGVDGILTENGSLTVGEMQQRLYLEVREGQAAVTPDAWFALE